MAKRVLVWDWDGTIADSLLTIMACKKVLAEKYSLTAPNEKQVRQALGMPFAPALKHTFPDCHDELRLTIGDEFHQLMQTPQFQADLFPGAKEKLYQLKNQGYIHAIATSKERNELDSALAHHDIIDLFDITCCGGDHTNKPHPHMMQIIQAHVNAHANECIMLGDTLKDMKFAENAGVPSIFVTFGAGHASDLDELTEKPVAYVESWDGLVSAITTHCPLTQANTSL